MATSSRKDDPRLRLLEEAKQVHAALDAEANGAAQVTFNQAQMLALIDARGDEATVSELAPKLDRAVLTMTSAVTGLQKLGLVERFAKKGEDRRIVRIRLTRQGKEALGKLVSLATVLVIIRAKDAPQSQQGSLSAYFGESIDAAWRGSLLFLADTLATMMRILVGGAIFWLLLAGGIWAVARHRRRAARQSNSP